jgi:hypothetical protein
METMKNNTEMDWGAIGRKFYDCCKARGAREREKVGFTM